MASSAFYPRSKTYGDKIYQSNGSKRLTNFEEKPYPPFSQAKTSYRQYTSKPAWYNQSSEYTYSNNYKKDSQFVPIETSWKSKQDNIKKGNYSPYSTMASEGDLETELTGFKIAQSGKILLDSQSSDSDNLFSPIERRSNKGEERFASATKFLGPSPSDISMPSFL